MRTYVGQAGSLRRDGILPASSSLRFLCALCVSALSTNLPAQTTPDEAFIGARAKYWAFQKVVRPPVPLTHNPWIRNPIDAFILDGLTQKRLAPSPALDRNRLIRRVTLDLTGLPPTPADVEAFLKDKSPDAYEKIVDRLLASPHYGERWAAKWLDVVRYADTNGFELDLERPNAWRYRDYVIHSFKTTSPTTASSASKSPATKCSPATRKRWSPPATCAPVRSTWSPAISIPKRAARKCSPRSPPTSVRPSWA